VAERKRLDLSFKARIIQAELDTPAIWQAYRQCHMLPQQVGLQVNASRQQDTRASRQAAVTTPQAGTRQTAGIAMQLNSTPTLLADTQALKPDGGPRLRGKIRAQPLKRQYGVFEPIDSQHQTTRTEAW